jgi:hypothetical protein
MPSQDSPAATFDFENLDAAAAWGQSATLPAATYGLPNYFREYTRPRDMSGTYTRHRKPTGPSGGTVPVGDILGMESRSRMPP